MAVELMRVTPQSRALILRMIERRVLFWSGEGIRVIGT